MYFEMILFQIYHRIRWTSYSAWQATNGHRSCLDPWGSMRRRTSRGFYIKPRYTWPRDIPRKPTAAENPVSLESTNDRRHKKRVKLVRRARTGDSEKRRRSAYEKSPVFHHQERDSVRRKSHGESASWVILVIVGDIPRVIIWVFIIFQYELLG